MDAKPTITDVVAEFAAYLRAPGNGTWGSLHSVLDDGNVRNSDVEFCEAFAAERGDREGERLAGILRRMSRSQRTRLPRKVDEFIAAKAAFEVEAPCSGL